MGPLKLSGCSTCGLECVGRNWFKKEAAGILIACPAISGTPRLSFRDYGRVQVAAHNLVKDGNLIAPKPRLHDTEGFKDYTQDYAVK